MIFHFIYLFYFWTFFMYNERFVFSHIFLYKCIFFKHLINMFEVTAIFFLYLFIEYLFFIYLPLFKKNIPYILNFHSNEPYLITFITFLEFFLIRFHKQYSDFFSIYIWNKMYNIIWSIKIKIKITTLFLI